MPVKLSNTILIHGAGPTGSLLAISLSRIGFNIILRDINTRDQIISRSRAYAITHSSRRNLQSLNLWNALSEGVNSFKKLTVLDSLLDYNVKFTVKDLHLQNRQYNSIGWIIDHQFLMETLFNEIDKISSIQDLTGDQYKVNEFQSLFLEIGADGYQSKFRKERSFRHFKSKYQSACLTAKVLIRGAEITEAYEIFRPDGPLAILPIKGDNFQIVLTAPLKKCCRLAKLPPPLFLDYLAAQLPKGIQPDSLIDIPRYYPIELSFSIPFFKRNYILIGEASHRCHPVGGQGLNVCWRDIECLSQLLRKSYSNKHINMFKIRFFYNFIRSIDIAFISILTHFLVKIYSTSSIILMAIRFPFLRIIEKLPFMRKLILFLMSDGLCLDRIQYNNFKS